MNNRKFKETEDFYGKTVNVSVLPVTIFIVSVNKTLFYTPLSAGGKDLDINRTLHKLKLVQSV